MDKRHFETGDRVTLQQSIFGLPAGTLGTVVRVYLSIQDYCQVRFDLTNRIHPIPCYLLAPVQQPYQVDSPIAPGAQTSGN